MPADLQSAQDAAGSCRMVSDERVTCAFADRTVPWRPIRAARSCAVGLQSVFTRWSAAPPHAWVPGKFWAGVEVICVGDIGDGDEQTDLTSPWMGVKGAAGPRRVRRRRPVRGRIRDDR